MVSLRESNSFIWDINDELGRGACGTVYLGRKKDNGDQVAVKVFNHDANMRSKEIQAREVNMLKKINHRNIVRLLAIEPEERSKRRKNVIVMELCTGGSLLKILDHPENYFGLPEDEFLLVLEHLMAGTKYLRDNNFIHRDLKPANIMKYVGDDGQSIYKLADFDAARELYENQEFGSLYGTEEYLHPDMYEQALLPHCGIPKQFSASVDLWSIGVSLYHVATGKLPFRPFGGRQNRETMHFMTTKKESGVICAYQTAQNKDIEQERELPTSCHLSDGLKKLITPLLAGLMEVNTTLKLSYENFFAEVASILERKPLHVFYLNQVKSLRIYINTKTHTSYNDLLSLIKEQTGIRVENQILLFRDSTLFSILEDGVLPLSAIPDTSEESPVILCHREDGDVVTKQFNKTLKFELFSNCMNYDNDALIARDNCSIGYEYKRRIEKSFQYEKLINLTVQTINQVVSSQLTTVSKENLQIRSTVHSLSHQFDMMKGFHKLCKSFLTYIPSSTKEALHLQEIVQSMEEAFSSQLEDFQNVTGRLIRLKPSLDHLLGTRVENRSLIVEWDKESAKITGFRSFAVLSTTAANLTEKIRQSSHSLCDVRVVTDVNERSDKEYIHLMERLKMMNKCKALDTLFKNECRPAFEKLVGVFSDWYKKAQAAFIQPEILAKDIIDLREDILVCEHQLNEGVKNFQIELQNFTQGLALADAGKSIPSEIPTPSVPTAAPRNQLSEKNSKKLRRRFSELSLVQQEIKSNFKVTTDLCNQLQGLLADSMNASNSIP